MSKNLIYNRGLLDPFFDTFFCAAPESQEFGRLAMKTDIKEEGENYVLEVELPGFDKKDIHVNLEEGYLTVEASVDTLGKEDKKNVFVRRERFSGNAKRSYYVGDIPEDSIKASYRDGILFVSFPKEAPKVDKNHAIAID